MDSIVPVEVVERKIYLIWGQKVMLDAGLAALYGVLTKVLNQAVKRNKERFPVDFIFQLTKEEKDEVVTNCDHLKRLRFSPTLPHAFTEHGAIMLATILNSTVAVKASIQVVRAFVRLRQMLASNVVLARKLDALEKSTNITRTLILNSYGQARQNTRPLKFRQYFCILMKKRFWIKLSGGSYDNCS